MDEIWKDIKGFEGYYQVSTLGNVRSLDRIITYGDVSYELKGRILKPADNTKRLGYPSLVLSKDGKQYSKLVHRLVASAFIPNPDNLPEVNHIDGNKRNNNVENLEWVTRRDNILHSWKLGLSSDYSNHKQIAQKLFSKPVYCIDTKTMYPSRSVAAKVLGVSSDQILSSIKRGGSISCKGPNTARYRFLDGSKLSDKDIKAIELKDKQFHNIFENCRNVIEATSLQVFTSKLDALNKLKIPDSTYYSKININGIGYKYIPKYNVCLIDIGYAESLNSSNLSQEECSKILLNCQIEWILSRYKTVVEDGNGEIYPNCSYAEHVLNIPKGSVAESIRCYDGVYKKKNMKFKYLDMSNISKSLIIPFISYYLTSFNTIRTKL